jgi:hypothetical protein
MYDSLRLFGADALRLRCAAGHALQDGLQTKDFDCLLEDYYVFEGHLYVKRLRPDVEMLVPTLDGEQLVLTHNDRASPLAFSGTISAYTHCEECDPIVCERECFDRIDHRSVWCEWDLGFERGRLVRTEPIRLETRDELRKQMTRDGLGVLPDDDRIARKEVKRLREGRRNR